MNDVESVRARVYEIQDQLDIDTVKALAGAAHVDAYKLPIAKARQQMADRQSYLLQRITWQSAKDAVKQAKETYDASLVALPSMQSNLEAMKKNKEELEALLAQVTENIQNAEQAISDHPNTIIANKEKVADAIRQATELKKNLKPVPGTDADDAAIIDEADMIRLRAIEAINNLLSR